MSRDNSLRSNILHAIDAYLMGIAGTQNGSPGESSHTLHRYFRPFQASDPTTLKTVLFAACPSQPCSATDVFDSPKTPLPRHACPSPDPCAASQDPYSVLT